VLSRGNRPSEAGRGAARPRSLRLLPAHRIGS
jgi:hypothetical protein